MEPIRAIRQRMASMRGQIAKLRTVQQGVVEDLLSGETSVPAA